VALDTKNSGGLTGTSQTGQSVTVEILIGTFIQSIGRDVEVGEIVTISDVDARFVIPYKYAVRATEEAKQEAKEAKQEEKSNTTVPEGKRKNS
jgi:ribosomal protein L9